MSKHSDMRQARPPVILRLALAVTLLLPLYLAGSAAATPVAATSWVVSGRAGSMATFSLPRSAPYAGSTLTATASKGGWAGAVLVQPDQKANASPYISTLSLSQSFVCPQSTCPWTAVGPTDWRSDDTKQWLRGSANVVLFGQPGSTVTVRFATGTSKGAPVRVTATQIPLEYLGKATSGTDPTRHQQRILEFHRLGRGGRWIGLSTVVAYVVRPVGALVESHCMTSGGGQTLDSIGGSTPCFDHSGEDFIGGPNAYPSTPVGGIVPVGTYQYGGWGDARYDMGIGSDVTVTGVETYLHAVTMGVRLG